MEGEVEGEGVGGGEFEVGGDGFGEFEEVAEGLGFGVGVAREDEEWGAAGEGASDGEAGFEMAGGGAAVEGEDRDAAVGFFGGGDGAGEAPLFRVVAEKRFEWEGWEVEGEVHDACFWECRVSSERHGDAWLGLAGGCKPTAPW